MSARQSPTKKSSECMKQKREALADWVRDLAYRAFRERNASLALKGMLLARTISLAENSKKGLKRDP